MLSNFKFWYSNVNSLMQQSWDESTINCVKSIKNQAKYDSEFHCQSICDLFCLSVYLWSQFWLLFLPGRFYWRYVLLTIKSKLTLKSKLTMKLKLTSKANMHLKVKWTFLLTSRFIDFEVKIDCEVKTNHEVRPDFKGQQTFISKMACESRIIDRMLACY